MYHKKMPLLKLKKKCQEVFYESIVNVLDIKSPQTFIPAFTKWCTFENEYSKKMFIFNSKYILLNISRDLDEKNNDNTDSVLKLDLDLERQNNLKFEINELCQGNIKGKIVDKNLYIKSKTYQDYNNFVSEIPIFIKSNPLLDVLYYMEGKYDFNTIIPSVSSFLTNKKINNINNNAYIEVIVAYYLNLLNESKECSLFPHYYGSFNGLAKNYVHNISEDYPHIKGCDWLKEKNEVLGYEIIRDNNLDDYQDLSLKNVFKIDYELEKDLKHKNDMANEINFNLDSENLENFNKNELNLDNFNLDAINLNLDSDNLNSDTNLDINKDNLKQLNQHSLSSDSDNESYSSSSWSDISSCESCIFNETYVKIKNFPIQILAMEKLEITLTNLIKKGIDIEEWRSILFEICFGMAIAQKKFSFVHNDLHSDNIMFKKCNEEYKYFKFKNNYFKIPTFGRETKVIDFARGIIKIGGNTFFSDVFKKEGDAGGQYNYLENKKNKKLNFSFDLARLGSTIAEFIKDSDSKKEIFKLINDWTTNKDGDNFLDMDDDFSLYVIICETANNAIPKDQLNKKIFEKFRIKKLDIPENKHIYELY